jgi:hypothetical protein
MAILARWVLALRFKELKMGMLKSMPKEENSK